MKITKAGKVTINSSGEIEIADFGFHLEPTDPSHQKVPYETQCLQAAVKWALATLQQAILKEAATKIAKENGGLPA